MMKIEILIKNSEGKRFVFINSEMAISLAKQLPHVTIKGAEPTDIIFSDWSLKFCKGRGAILPNYIILEKSDSEKISKKIISKIYDMRKKQYERYMMIRVLKRNFRETNELEILKLQLECCKKENYMIDLKLFRKILGDN